MKFSALFHHYFNIISTLFQHNFNLTATVFFRAQPVQDFKACARACRPPSLPVRLRCQFGFQVFNVCLRHRALHRIVATVARDIDLQLARATLRERSRNQLPDRHFSLIGSRSRPASGPDWRKPQSVHILRRTAQPDRTAGTTRMG